MLVCTKCNHAYSELSPQVSRQNRDWFCPHGHHMTNTVSSPWRRWLLSIVFAGFSTVTVWILVMIPYSHRRTSIFERAVGNITGIILVILIGMVALGALRAVFCFLKALVEWRRGGAIKNVAVLDFNEGLAAILSVVINSALIVAYCIALMSLSELSY